MMKRFGLTLGVAVAAGCVVLVPAGPAGAQFQGQGQRPANQAAGLETLPPALRAAVMAGNAQQVSQALTTLSGGNPTQFATLAAQVVTAAEKLLTTNPQAAISAAAAAVQSVRQASVQQSSPQQTESVLTTAARIFVNPAAQRVAPESVAQLASATVAAAGTTNNPVLVASVSNNAVSTAEKLLSSNPQAAIQLAAAAVETVKSQVVQQSSPQQTMQVVTTAARILVDPEAQRVAPQTVAGMATTVVAVVSNPVVYQSSPSAALTVMGNAYAAATSQVVVAAVPGVTGQVTQGLRQAGQNSQLTSSNPTNPAEIDNILANRGKTPGKDESGASPVGQSGQTPPVVDDRGPVSPS